MSRVRKVLVTALCIAGAAALAPTAQAAVYWLDGSGAVARANFDGSGLQPALVAPPSAIDPNFQPLRRGLAVDSQFVYWLNGSNGTIGRARLDGSGPQDAFIANPSPNKMGYNGLTTAAGYLFAKDSQYQSSIWRARADGSEVPSAVVTGPDKLITTGFAVDADHIYVSYWNSTYPTVVHRYNLDGSGDTVIMNDQTTGELAVDGSYLYWTTNGPYIGRARLDGTDPQPHFIQFADRLDVSALMLAAGGGHLCWGTNPVPGGDVVCAAVDGTNITTVAQHASPTAVAVDGLTSAAPNPTPTPTPVPNRAPAPGTHPAAAVTNLAVARNLIATWWRPTDVSPVRRQIVGASVSFRLSRAASVRFQVDRAGAAHAATLGSFTLRGHRGSNRFWFSGRIAGHALRLGHYRLTATSGSGSTTAAFEVVPLHP